MMLHLDISQRRQKDQNVSVSQAEHPSLTSILFGKASGPVSVKLEAAETLDLNAKLAVCSRV